MSLPENNPNTESIIGNDVSDVSADVIYPAEEALNHQHNMHAVSGDRTREIIAEIGERPQNLPLIGKLKPRAQYGIAIGLLVGGLGLSVLIASTGFLKFSEYQARTEYGTRLEMLSQRLLASTIYTISGNADSFAKLGIARKEVDVQMSNLNKGTGSANALDASKVVELKRMNDNLQKDVLPLVDRVLSIGQQLSFLGSNNARLNEELASVASNSERLAVLLQSTGAPELNVTAAFQLQNITERVQRNANLLMNSYDQNAQNLSEESVKNLDNTFPEYRAMFGSKWTQNGNTLQVDGQTVNDNFDQVDAFQTTYGGNATVFVVDGKNFRRVSTSVLKEDGTRAVGTLLGQEHPAYRALQAGGTYMGQAVLFGRPYATKYEAIKDASGKIVGVLFIGYDTSRSDQSLTSMSDYNSSWKNLQTTIGTLYSGDAKAGIPAVQNESARRILEDIKASMDKLTAVNQYVNDNASAMLDARRSLAALSLQTESALLNATAFTDEMRKSADASYRTVYFASIFVLIALAGLALIGLVSNRLTRQEAWKSMFDSKRNEKDIIDFMEACMPLEMGDLTVNFSGDLQSMEGITGGIRNSVGEAVQSLREAMHTVKNTADDVSRVVSDSVSNTTQMRSSNEEQSVEIKNVSDRMTGLTKIFQLVEGRTKIAVDTTEDARIASEQGAKLVQRTNEKMGEIRTTMQDVLKSVKNLGETSHEIGTIVNAIEQITDRTQVLAVNASLEAAKAGAAGSGFSVIANEVNRLAEQSAEALRTVTALVQRVQGETGVTIRIVEESTNNVVEGASLSNEANQQLSRISTLAASLANDMTEISKQTAVQSVSAGEVQISVDRLAVLSENFQTQVSEVVDGVSQIDNQMGTLKETVDTFTTEKSEG